MFRWEKAIFIKQKQWLLLIPLIPLFLVMLLISHQPEEERSYSLDIGILQSRMEQRGELTEEMSAAFTTIYELERKELTVALFKQEQAKLLDLLIEKEAILKQVLPTLPIQTASIKLEPLEVRIQLFQYAVAQKIDLMASESLLGRLTGLISLFTYNVAGIIFILMLMSRLTSDLTHQSIVEKVYSQKQLRLGRAMFIFLVGYCLPIVFFLLGLFLIGAINGVNVFVLPISYFTQTGLTVTSMGGFLFRTILYQMFGLVVLYQLVCLLTCLGADVPLTIIILALAYLPLLIRLDIWTSLPMVHAQALYVYPEKSAHLLFSFEKGLVLLGVDTLVISGLLELARRKKHLYFI